MAKLGVKLAAVVAIAVMLLIPLGMIRGLIGERTEKRAEVRTDIARSWTGSQRIAGPVLRVPGREPLGPGAEAGPGDLFLLPSVLAVDAALRTERRWRGVYSVPVYTATLVLEGEFDLGAAEDAIDGWADLDDRAAELTLGLCDNRGIVGLPALEWDGASRRFVAGSALSGEGGGLRAAVGAVDVPTGRTIPFRIELGLRGMDELAFALVGDDTRVTLDASWPHPSFVGRFLPVEHEISEDGFTGEWRVTGLATAQRRAWRGTAADGPSPAADAFGVALNDPVDIYQQSLRSAKYGILIIVLTFTGFGLIEIVRRLDMHPMQYLLVGLSLVVFFVLLLALAEHVGFAAAYGIATLSCLCLIGTYMAAVLRSAASAGAVTGTLAGLYGMLYVILRSEDYALLMGSVLLFAALATVMLVTRHLDWYSLAAPAPAGGGGTPEHPVS